MKAVILAAGEGSRLRPLTFTTPKPLMEVKGRPIIEHIFSSLPDEIDQVLIVVGYLQDKIRNYLGDHFMGKKVIYIEQGNHKGTLGALWSAKPHLENRERFLVLNGDDLHSKDELNKFLDFPRAFGAQRNIMPNYYFVLKNNEGCLAGFRKQTEEEKEVGALIATGVYLLDAEIFNHPGVVINGGEYGLPQTVEAMRETHPIIVVETSGWVPINSSADLEAANQKFTK